METTEHYQSLRCLHAVINYRIPTQCVKRVFDNRESKEPHFQKTILEKAALNFLEKLKLLTFFPTKAEEKKLNENNGHRLAKD